jgi:FKBP-type peptidyl-prolyl cis-trans isomerase
MKKIILLCSLALCVATLSFAQQKKPSGANAKTTIELNKEYTTASGLKYKITEKGKGPKAVVGANVSVHYVGTLLDGTKFDSSRDRGQPFNFKLGEGRVIKGWDEGIALLNVGDKAIFTIPSTLGYGPNAMGKIPANATLIFEVELVDVKEPVKPWNVTSKDTITTASGLKYIVVEKSTKPVAVQAQIGRNVEVHYTGFLAANNRVFDSSIERGQPITFPLGQGMVIKGWEEGIALMKEGDKFRLIIPSELGYGDNGMGNMIPPKSTLIFDVELVGVK